MDTEFLRKKTNPKKLSFPWEHYLIDDFLPSEHFKKVQEKLCSVKDGYKKRDDDQFDLNFMFLPDLHLAKMFLSEDFQNFLESATKTKLEIYDKSLVQLRLMTPDSPAFEPHIDSQEVRSLVCIWYVSPNWAPACGGELVLLQEKNSDLLGNESKLISPLENRMIFFFSDDTHWHAVNKVVNWNRYSVISEWIVTN